jgi:hypothetical protein
MADTREEYILTSLTARRVALRDEAEAALHRPRVNWTKPRKYAPPDRNASKDFSLRPDLLQGTLCSFCAKLSISQLVMTAQSDGRLVSDDMGGHHYSPHDLEYSAENCPLCAMFCIELRRKWSRVLWKLASPPPVAPHWGQCRFKIWARNGEIVKHMDDDKQLQYLVLSWVGSRTTIEVELLMSAEHGVSHNLYILRACCFCCKPRFQVSVPALDNYS